MRPIATYIAYLYFPYLFQQQPTYCCMWHITLQSMAAHAYTHQALNCGVGGRSMDEKHGKEKAIAHRRGRLHGLKLSCNACVAWVFLVSWATDRVPVVFTNVP